MSRSHYVLIIEQLITDLNNLFMINQHGDDIRSKYMTASYLSNVLLIAAWSKNKLKVSSEIIDVFDEISNVFNSCNTIELKEYHADLLPAIDCCDTLVDIVINNPIHNYTITATEIAIIHRFTYLIFKNDDCDMLDIDTYTQLANACNMRNVSMSAAMITDIVLQDKLFIGYQELMIFILILFMANCNDKTYIFDRNNYSLDLHSGTIKDILNTVSITRRYEKIIKYFKFKNFTRIN